MVKTIFSICLPYVVLSWLNGEWILLSDIDPLAVLLWIVLSVIIWISIDTLTE